MDVLISDNMNAEASQKVKDNLICTALSPMLVNLTINIKIMLNAVLGTPKMSAFGYSPSPVPPVIFGYYVFCMMPTS